MLFFISFNPGNWYMGWEAAAGWGRGSLLHTRQDLFGAKKHKMLAQGLTYEPATAQKMLVFIT